MKSFRQRKSLRLQDYDYSSEGAYFVTICTQHRQCLFGEVRDDTMHLSAFGKIAHNELEKLPGYWNTLDVDFFVVMPNHVHLIVCLHSVGAAFLPPAAPDAQKRVPTLGQIIGSYKAGVTRRIREFVQEPEYIVWQSRYHDHIIRNETSLNDIRKYILHNPQMWLNDVFFTDGA